MISGVQGKLGMIGILKVFCLRGVQDKLTFWLVVQGKRNRWAVASYALWKWEVLYKGKLTPESREKCKEN